MQNKDHNRTKSSDNDAHHQYTARQSDIARLIDVLQMELEKHASEAKADPKNWGRVGDLGKVRSDLIEVVSFMSGFDRAQIKEFLAE